MKVIAKISEKQYLCEVSHDELEKSLNQYYGNMRSLTVGQEMDLGQGYNFAARIESACKKMAEAMAEFDRARTTMTAYALAIADRAKGEGEQP